MSGDEFLESLQYSISEVVAFAASFGYTIIMRGPKPPASLFPWKVRMAVEAGLVEPDFPEAVEESPVGSLKQIGWRGYLFLLGCKRLYVRGTDRTTFTKGWASAWCVPQLSEPQAKDALRGLRQDRFLIDVGTDAETRAMLFRPRRPDE